MGIGVLFILQKMREGTLSLKKEEVGKIVEEWRLLTDNNLSLLANLCVYNSRNITIPGIYIKVTSFIIHPNFWDMVLRKI